MSLGRADSAAGSFNNSVSADTIASGSNSVLELVDDESARPENSESSDSETGFGPVPVKSPMKS
jgi:hypothetical protein